MFSRLGYGIFIVIRAGRLSASAFENSSTSQTLTRGRSLLPSGRLSALEAVLQLQFADRQLQNEVGV